MKRIVSSLLFLIALSLCVSCASQNVPSSSYSEQSTQASSRDEASARTESQKILTNDFEQNGTQIQIFSDCQMQIPQSWEVVNEEDKTICFIPEEENPPLFSFSALDVKKNEDLSTEESQKNLANEIIRLYGSMEFVEECILIDYELPREYITLSSGEKLDVTGREVLHVNCYGKVNSKNYTGKIEAFYLGEQLYAFALFQYENSIYDFTNDMESIRNTIKKAVVSDGNDDIKESDEPSIKTDSDVSQIEVTYKVDYLAEKLHMIVYVKNNSEQIFSGNIYVTFCVPESKKALGSDTIIVNNLYPGNENWSKISVEAYDGQPKMETAFSEVVYSSVDKIASEIDEEVTSNTRRSYQLNFEGVSWYDDIEDITVYVDGNCLVTIKDNARNDGKFYASTIWSCGNNYGVVGVRVINKEGIVISVYE